MTVLEIPTPRGPAKAHLHKSAGEAGALILGHGAGGGVGARDLVTATEAALSVGLTVALIEQPYRVAGRRSPAPATQLDAAWKAVIAELVARRRVSGALIVGGRSAGARVACRTAADVGATAVLCLAFPLHPPGRPEKTRQGELDAVALPALVVQGESDPFGVPAPGPGHELVTVKGNHSLATDLDAVGAAVRDWLGRLLPATGTGAGATRTGARRAR